MTGNKHGEKLMTLVGFSLVDTHPEFPEKKIAKADHTFRLPQSLSIQYIKGVKLEL